MHGNPVCIYICVCVFMNMENIYKMLLNIILNWLNIY